MKLLSFKNYFTKKIIINKLIRIVLIAITSIILCSSIFYLMYSLYNPKIVEEKVKDYSYSQKANVNYRVYLYSNPIYKEKSLDAGEYYLSPFIRKINTFFTYHFSGDKPASFTGDYYVSAYLQGILREREEIKTVWSREYELVPLTPIQGEEKEQKIEKEIGIDYQYFNNFVQSFLEDYKINNEVRLLVKWKVNIAAENADGLVKEEASPSIIIPLNKDFFQINGESNIEKNGGIEHTIQKELPVDNRKIIVLAGSITVSLLGLLFLLIFTKVLIIHPFERERSKIFKNHGCRLVGLDKDLDIDKKSIITVKAIEDLVLIADEISKPIMYKEYSHTKGKLNFYVFEESKVYLYTLEFKEKPLITKEIKGNRFTGLFKKADI